MIQVRWTADARKDLRDIRDFIARDSPWRARTMIRRLLSATRRLETFPRSGRMVPEANREDIRELILGPYRIIYGVTADRVSVLAVIHSARLLDPVDLPVESPDPPPPEH